MPVTDDGYRKLTEEEIYARLKADFENTFDSSVEPGDLIQHQLAAEAKTLAENQEESLERVYKSAYLEDAEGAQLDKLVSLIGLDRRDEVSAGGTVVLQSEEVPVATYTIPKNTTVQTEGSNPIRFKTTETASLTYIDGFETDLNKWEGDDTDFSIETASPLAGGGSLKVPAVSGVQLTTLKSDFKIGTTFNFDFAPSSGSVTAFRFGDTGTDYHEVKVDANSNDLDLRTYEDDTEVAGQSVNETIPTDAFHIEFEWSLHGDLRVGLYESDARDTLIRQLTLAYEPSWTEGAVSIRSEDATATALVDECATSRTTANIQAEDGGVYTNVGPNSITVAPSGITGVQTITNSVATGDVTYTNTDLSPLVLGRDEEGDDELRQRAFDNSSIGGAASVSALETVLSNIEGVQSVSIKRNRENTVVDGLPASSYEPIVYGGMHRDIAEALHSTAAIDSQDVGGIHGNMVTYDIESDVLGSTETYTWSEPIEVSLNITLDLVIDENYVGDADIKSLVADYIGGTDIDGSQLPGLSNGESVYEAVLMGKLVDPVNHGVWEVDSILIDGDNDGSDDTTETASGADVYAITDDKVAVTDARDGSITVNTTLK